MLSDEDRRRLQDIEAAIRMEDPRFADRLAEGRAPARARRAVALVLVALGVLGLLAGMALLSGVMMLFAVLVTGMGAALWFRHGGRRRPAG
ncbi:DUF3040 domain-containing protein [Pseudonocardia sp. RS11V-5]|uniref:DUF3040 domain-containing protein n=1 Tax=Pseudonocardia terrae TaxID=2905831 RepID=UPI001E296DF5|nr:DUF3040 domain-containing protein [Pseudonocardia terrae]MCE3553112.1 DUF3040 domain-containing protein [Pseudonocardia terrae]